MEESKKIKIALLTAGLFLCFSVLPVWSAGYFILLRCVVCGAASYTVYAFRERKDQVGHTTALIIIAVLFNPVVPVYPTRLVGLLLNLGVAFYFLNLSKKTGI